MSFADMHPNHIASAYAAGSEADPHYRDLDDPAPADTRSPTRSIADENASRAVWGLPPIEDERSAA